MAKTPTPAPKVNQLNPPHRVLLGPGPSNCHPSVHGAMSMEQVGHLDPSFITIAEEVKEMIRYVWQTKNTFTIPCSGTGSAAWEATVANLIVPGDKNLVFVNGYFGERHCDMASRYGAEVIRVDKPWGEVFTLDEVKAAITEHKPQIVWMCHAETSTGACQPVEGVGAFCHENDCLFTLDTVTSIGGLPVYLDDWEVDACYAGGQKCLSCPPGISPVTFSDRAIAKLRANVENGHKIPTWYLDMNLIAKYLVVEGSGPRVYHHTAPVSMMYALHQSLNLICQEGLEQVWKRHRETAEYFWAELEKVGLDCHVTREHRLPSLHTVCIPEGIDGKKVVVHLREKFDIEIGGGLGSLGGKVWRIGLMGFNSRKDNVILVVAALCDALKAQGWKPKA